MEHNNLMVELSVVKVLRIQLITKAEICFKTSTPFEPSSKVTHNEYTGKTNQWGIELAYPSWVDTKKNKVPDTIPMAASLKALLFYFLF